jgi:hypothetical protein
LRKLKSLDRNFVVLVATNVAGGELQHKIRLLIP